MPKAHHIFVLVKRLSGKITYCLCWTMALLTLNSSVDIADYKLYRNPDNNANTYVNEMESLVELVVEDIFQQGNKFPEKKNDDTTSNSVLKKGISFQKIMFAEVVKPVPPVEIKIEYIVENLSYTSSFVGDIFIPPPNHV